MGNCCGRHKQHTPRKRCRIRPPSPKVLQSSNDSRPIRISKLSCDTISQTVHKVQRVSKLQQTESQENSSRPIIIDYDLSVINRARSMSLNETKFIKIDSKPTIIKLKQIDPSTAAKVIREQLHKCDIHENKVELEACIEELETSASYDITTGSFKLLKILLLTQNATVQHLHIGYHLFKVNSIQMCNFVFVSIAGKREDIDIGDMAIGLGIWSGLGFLFFPFGMALTAATLMTIGLGIAIDDESDRQRIDSPAAILKILEYYHLIRFLPDDRIELLLD